MDGGTQHRVKILKQAVDDYVAALESEQELPPIEVVWDGQFYWVVDGHHRVEAHRQYRGARAEINCVVSRGTQQEAQWLSLGANKVHGVRRTRADKQKAVRFALNHPGFKNMSDRKIAKQTGVDHGTVGRWREQVAGESTTRPKSAPSAQELLDKAITAAKRATGLSWKGQVLQHNGMASLELAASAIQADAGHIPTEDLDELAA